MGASVGIGISQHSHTCSVVFVSWSWDSPIRVRLIGAKFRRSCNDIYSLTDKQTNGHSDRKSGKGAKRKSSAARRSYGNAKQCATKADGHVKLVFFVMLHCVGADWAFTWLSCLIVCIFHHAWTFVIIDLALLLIGYVSAVISTWRLILSLSFSSVAISVFVWSFFFTSLSSTGIIDILAFTRFRLLFCCKISPARGMVSFDYLVGGSVCDVKDGWTDLMYDDRTELDCAFACS